MAILAGIDLLGKFYAGDDTIGQVGQRFTSFIRKYLQPLSPGDEDVLYQLRNSLLHSFGLYSSARAQTYHFMLTGKGGVPFIQQPRTTFYQVDLIVLHERFERAIVSYVNDLEADPNLQTKFLTMFPNYGAIEIT